MNARDDFNEEHGFTLVELLVAIVVVGILTAIAIVGIRGLTDTAKKATCQTTLDASRAAVISYYSSQSPHVYPADFDVMTCRLASRTSCFKAEFNTPHHSRSRAAGTRRSGRSRWIRRPGVDAARCGRRPGRLRTATSASRRCATG